MWKRVVGTALAGAGLYAARRFYRNWGTTKAECETPLPGDELVRRPAVQTTEGVWIDAPAEEVWSWLVQMGQDRGGLYSYEPLENLVGLKFRNADRIHPEWQRLAIGDVIRLAPRGWIGLREGLALPVAQIVEGQSIVLRVDPSRLPWDGVWSFHVVPRWEDRSRLLVRSRSRLRMPGEVIGSELSAPVVSLMTRGMLLGIKRRAEAARQLGQLGTEPPS
jgi:hypothetical protein